MKIVKIFNNNVVLSIENEKEVIIMGKGIAFNKKVGDEIENDKIEKNFVLEDDTSYKIKKLIDDIPTEYFEITNEIITYAKNILNVEFNNHLYITLTDHISFAVERYRKGIKYMNNLHWEIKKFYPKEYEVALKAVDLINEELDVCFSSEEAANITIHLVNSKLNNNIDITETIEMTKMIQDVLNIIKYSFNIEINENSLSYERLITHLKFFFHRLKSGKQNNDDDDFLYLKIKEKYKNSFECAEKIRQYVIKTHNMDLTMEEMCYLTVHIKRIRESK